MLTTTLPLPAAVRAAVNVHADARPKKQDSVLGAVATPPPPSRLLRLPEVLARVPVSKPSLYRAIRRGEFPAPVKLFSGRGSAWSEAEVTAYIEARLAARNGGRA